MQDICRSPNQSALNLAPANVLHQRVGQRLLQHLEPMTITAHAILDVGCGESELSSLLAARFPEATVTDIDLTRQSLKHSDKSVVVNHINEHTYKLPFVDGQFDLVIANLVPHWFSDLSAWLMEMQRVLRTDGLLMLSYYGPDTLNEVGTPQPTCYDLHTMGDTLVRAAFNDPVLDVERFILEYDDYDDLLEDLQASREHALFTLPTIVKGSLEVTYEIIYAHAWKGEQSMTSKIDQDGMVRISLEQVKHSQQ